MYTLTLCKQLQTVNACVLEACNHVNNVLAFLDEMRENDEKHFSNIFAVAVIMLIKRKVEIDLPRFFFIKQAFCSNTYNFKEYYILTVFCHFSII